MLAPNGKGTGWKPGRGTKAHLFGVSDAPQVRSHEGVAYKYYPDNTWWGDQGSTSQCTIYSWLHILHDSPITRRGPMPIADPTKLYQRGQFFDGTPLRDVDSGLTCDSAAKVMREMGWITAWRWANDLDEILDALVSIGPVALGSPWPSGMSNPDPRGLVSFSGDDDGLGHQFDVNGFSKKDRVLRCKNSWGRGWARQGRFYIRFEDVPKMFAQWAAAAVASEIKPIAA